MKSSQTFNFLFFLIFSTSLLSSQNKNDKNYVCLNTQNKYHETEIYELEIPPNWCAYYGFHDVLSYSPKSLQNLKNNFYKNYLSVSSYDNNTYKSIDIEEALKNHVLAYNLGTDFDRSYTSDFHDIYGKYYIVKYKSVSEGDKLMNLDILFNYKNRDYIIRYSVLEYQFNLYVNNVIKIISSFQIKE